MSKLKYIGIALLCFTLSACKKINYKTTKVRGILWDYCREMGMGNIKVLLLEGSYGRGGAVSYTALKELTTNADGAFDFGEFEADNRINKHFYKVVYVASEENTISKGPACCGEPWNMENLDMLKVNVAEENYDTLRLCTINANKGKITIIPPPPYSESDSLFIASYNKYNILGTLIYSKYNNILTKADITGSVLTNLTYYDCGIWYLKIIKVKNGVKTETYDQVEVKWKTDPAFEYTINF